MKKTIVLASMASIATAALADLTRTGQIITDDAGGWTKEPPLWGIVLSVASLVLLTRWLYRYLKRNNNYSDEANGNIAFWGAVLIVLFVVVTWK